MPVITSYSIHYTKLYDYDVGTVSTILQMLKLPDGTVKVLVEGAQRAEIGKFIETEPYFQAELTMVAHEQLDERVV